VINLAADYFLLNFLAALGAIQIAAAWSGLAGLLFVPRPIAGFALGGGLLVGSFTWFVLTGDPGIPGDLGGVEGSEQFGLFLAAAAAATIGTLIGASLTQFRRRTAQVHGAGLEALRQGTALAALRSRLRARGRHA